MRLQERHKFVVLMALHLLWGLVLLFSISKYGLGVSTDAVHLLFGGLNLASGHGLTSYDGSFLVLWPPLYPVLLALIHATTGAPMPLSAALIQILAFLGLATCLTVLFLKIFRDNFGLAIAATVLAQVGSVVLISFGMVGPDYLHFFLVALVLVLTARYVETGSRLTFVALGAACILVTLQRYLGVAAVAASALTIALIAQGMPRQRLAHALVICTSILPMAVWLKLTSPLYTRRPPISLEENFGWFSRSILEWFVAPGMPKRVLEHYVPLLWFVVLALVITVLVFAGRRRSSESPEAGGGGAPEQGSRLYRFPLLLYGICYTLALFGSASIAYFNKLGGRFLLPLYLPLILLPALAADAVIQAARLRKIRTLGVAATVVCGLALLALAVVLIRNTLPLVIESHANGAVGGENAFNNRAWRENGAIQYWMQHQPAGEYLLLSNEPDGVAFNTQHATRSAPRRQSGPYGTEDIPLDSYAARLFGSGSEVYLIWLKGSAYDYYYSPEQLDQIASVETLFDDPLGSVLRLNPKARQ